MNSIKDFWNRRIRFLLKLYYDFIAFQLDMVSLFYILAMGIFVGYYYYPEVGGYLQWIQQEPWRTLLFFFSIIIARGGKHTGYLKEADELFLTPLNLYGRKFIQRSHFLNRILSLFIWGIWIIIIAALGILELNPIGFFFTGLFWRYLSMNGRFFIQQISGKWTRKTIQFIYSGFLFTLTYGWVYYWDPWIGQGGGCIALVLFLAVLLWWTDQKKRKVDLHWSRMISEEANRRAQMLSAIIQVVPEEKSRGINTSKTLKAFSGRRVLPFTPLGGALLAFDRRMRRGKGNLSLLVKIALVHWIAIVLTEVTLVLSIMNLLVFFIVQEFCLSLWNGVLDEEWFKIYPFSGKAIERSITLGSFGYVLIYMIMSFSVQFFRWGNITEVGKMLLVSVVLVFLINQVRSTTVYFNYTMGKKTRGLSR